MSLPTETGQSSNPSLDRVIEAARRDGALDLYHLVVKKAKAACSRCEPVSTYMVAEAYDELFPPVPKSGLPPLVNDEQDEVWE